MAVQIVDARNPLMYYTEDLMKYASELEVRVVRWQLTSYHIPNPHILFNTNNFRSPLDQ
jgi:hypothetical protein